MIPFDTTHPSLRQSRLTLVQFFLGTIVVALAIVGGLLFALWAMSRSSVLRDAEAGRQLTALRVEESVRAGFRPAGEALRNVELAIRSGAIDASSTRSLETLLFSQLIGDPRLVAVRFTHAERLGFDAAGEMIVAPANHWRLSVYRRRDAEQAIEAARISEEDGEFVAEVSEPLTRAGLLGAPLRPLGAAHDPTVEATFRDATARESYGAVVRSDLHYAQQDAETADPAGRRVVVTEARAITTVDGRFTGVVSASMLEGTLDDVARVDVGPLGSTAPIRIFICDGSGRLVTRWSPTDAILPVDDTLRARPSAIPPEVTLALDSPVLQETRHAVEDRSTSVRVGGVPYLVTFHPLRESRDWVVGIVAPEDLYVHDLRALRDRLLVTSMAVGLLVLCGGLWSLRVVKRGLGKLLDATARMHSFDFSASEETTPFRDVQEVIESLERAKTAVRALGKYVPIDLVKELYESNREPTLGGHAREVTLMFSDIAGFTAISERLAPDALARALGAYFDEMANAVAATNGVVDKFIGDSLMALWNAPGVCADHPVAACRAALECIRRTRELYASPSWADLPPFVTRFGIHSDTVLVGHFGASSRLSYTALGDGVNLASRLEQLCKQYGVSALVSENVERIACEAFVFRAVDRVAVKGKTTAINVFELLGSVGDDIANLDVARAYERALEAYARRAFAEALTLLQACGDDGPARVLAERCRRYLASPPPADWDGTFHAEQK